MIRAAVGQLRDAAKQTTDMLVDNGVWKERTVGIGYLDLTGCAALGMTGPVLRATGLPWDLRKTAPYCDYETYDFDVVTTETCDAYGRWLIRIGEIEQSLRIIEQCLDRLEPGPVMVADKHIAWPAQLALGGDGLGNSLEHIAEIMGSSMEALIHHFARHRGLPGAGGSGVPGGRVAARRVGRPCGVRRRHAALSGALPRPVVQQPAGGTGHVRGRDALGRHRFHRRYRSGAGRSRPLTVEGLERTIDADQ